MQLLPKDEKFFDLFVEQADILSQTASALKGMAGDGSAVAGQLDRISELEQKADQIIGDVLGRLNRTFITPIDPEDVGALATGLENLTDSLESLAFRASACDAASLPDDVAFQTGRFEAVTKTLVEAFRRMQQKQLEDKDAILEDCAKARKEIGEIIKATREKLRSAYQNQKDPITLIRSRDMCECIEATARGFEHFVEDLQNIITKNS